MPLVPYGGELSTWPHQRGLVGDKDEGILLSEVRLALSISLIDDTSHMVKFCFSSSGSSEHPYLPRTESD